MDLKNPELWKSVSVSHVNHSVCDLLLLNEAKGFFWPTWKQACEHEQPRMELVRPSKLLAEPNFFAWRQSQREHQETDVVPGFKAI